MDSHTARDEELLAAAGRGDREAFTVLYRRRQGGIYRFALRMSGSTALAEDVTQEVFLALLRRPGDFDPARAPLSTFLFGIAHKLVLRALEKRGRHVSLEGSEAGERSDGQNDLADGMARDQQLRSLRDAVLSLPVHYREVVVLCELQEMSYAEAAAALGCAEGTVRSRLHRARALLVEKLAAVRRPQTASIKPNPKGCFA